MFEILELLVIIKKWILSIITDIYIKFKMVHRNEIIINLVNETQIREYEREKRDQTPEYIILNNGE